MKIKLKGVLDYELQQLGLMSGSIVEAQQDPMSEVGGMHFTLGNVCCSVWPENYTDDLNYYEVGMCVKVLENNEAKRGVVARIYGNNEIRVALIEESGSVHVKSYEILPNNYKTNH